ncbi:MAG: hypothetical protein M3457_06320 [Chloroflexota bacterium]|nr:hypothetical protein [Chloroflexota bacterium]
MDLVTNAAPRPERHSPFPRRYSLTIDLQSEPVTDLTGTTTYQATHLFIDNWCWSPAEGIYPC